MSATSVSDDAVPLLVVTDVAARLVRRGLLDPGEQVGWWRQARVLVFRRGPVVCEPPRVAWSGEVSRVSPR